MEQTMSPRKRIGLVAHDNKKPDLLSLAKYNQHLLTAHNCGNRHDRDLEDELGVAIGFRAGRWAVTSSSAR